VGAALEHLRRGPKQPESEYQEIIEVERIGSAQRFLVFRVELEMPISW
jgi:hypothetical protein